MLHEGHEQDPDHAQSADDGHGQDRKAPDCKQESLLGMSQVVAH